MCLKTKTNTSYFLHVDNHRKLFSNNLALLRINAMETTRATRISTITIPCADAWSSKLQKLPKLDLKTETLVGRTQSAELGALTWLSDRFKRCLSKPNRKDIQSDFHYASFLDKANLKKSLFKNLVIQVHTRNSTLQAKTYEISIKFKFKPFETPGMYWEYWDHCSDGQWAYELPTRLRTGQEDWTAYLHNDFYVELKSSAQKSSKSKLTETTV
jgi:hypothetical protein